MVTNKDCSLAIWLWFVFLVNIVEWWNVHARGTLVYDPRILAWVKVIFLSCQFLTSKHLFRACGVGGSIQASGDKSGTHEASGAQIRSLTRWDGTCWEVWVRHQYQLHPGLCFNVRAWSITLTATSCQPAQSQNSVRAWSAIHQATICHPLKHQFCTRSDSSACASRTTPRATICHPCFGVYDCWGILPMEASHLLPLHW